MNTKLGVSIAIAFIVGLLISPLMISNLYPSLREKTITTTSVSTSTLTKTLVETTSITKTTTIPLTKRLTITSVFTKPSLTTIVSTTQITVTTTQKLKVSLEHLQKEYEKLKGEYSKLKNEIETCKQNYTQLQQKYSELKSLHSKLMIKYEELNKSLTTLNQSYEQLQKEYSSLTSENQSIKSDYDKLKEEYNKLKEEYNSLKEKYEELLSKATQEKEAKIIKEGQKIEVPIYPDATKYEVPDELKTLVGIPTTTPVDGYLVNATIDDIFKWYEENMKSWTLQREEDEILDSLSVHRRIYVKNETGAAIIVLEGYKEAKGANVLMISIGPSSVMEKREGEEYKEVKEEKPQEKIEYFPHTLQEQLGEGSITFKTCPMNFNDFTEVEPLGNLNPKGGHVFPSDHGGFMFKDPNKYPPSYEVRAPADGIIIEIEYKQNDWPLESGFTGKYNDYTVTIAHTSTFLSRLGHISELNDWILEQAGELKVGFNSVMIVVKEGNIIGLAGGRPKAQMGLDWIIYDEQVTHFIHPEKYGRSAYAAHFLDYCDKELKAKLLQRIRRTAEPRVGKFDYDQLGKLVGNWFMVGVNEKEPLSDWDKHLAFVYYMYDPSQIRITFGKELYSVIGNDGYAVVGNAPDPATITVESGKVVYWLTSPPEAGVDRLPNLTLIVQMIDEETIKVEVFEGHIKDPKFTENAKTYTR